MTDREHSIVIFNMVYYTHREAAAQRQRLRYPGDWDIACVIGPAPEQQAFVLVPANRPLREYGEEVEK